MNARLFFPVAVFEPSVDIAVGEFVFAFNAAKDFDVPLQVSRCEENAGAMWAPVAVVAVVFLRHAVALRIA